MSKAVRLVAALLLACAVSVGAQTVSTMLNGLFYTFPASDGTSGQVLVNNGAGGLTWTTASPGGSAVMPADLIAFAVGACPSGWAEYTTGRGFYPVGATSGLGGTVGTALTTQENRVTGVHTHSASGNVNVSNGSHTHGLTDSGHVHANDTASSAYGQVPVWTYYDPGAPDLPYYDWDYPPPFLRGRAAGSQNSSSSGVGYSVSDTSVSVSGSLDSFTVDNGGTGTGTNAPYRQLRMCKKS